MGNSAGWLQGIQYFRAIAAIEVIIFHAMTYGRLLPPPQIDLINAVAALTYFAVPHFLFISGVVLYHKYPRDFHLPTFYKKRLGSVLPPYLVWSTFYYFYPSVIGVLYSTLFRPTSYGSNISLGGFLTALAIGMGQLWFLVLLIQLYVLYPFLVKLYNRFSRQNSAIYVLLLIFLAQLVFSILFLRPNSPVIFVDFFLSGVFYFVFGFFVAEHYGAILQKLTSVRLSNMSIVVVLSSVCYAGVSSLAPSQYILLYITGPLYCLILIAFYLRLSTEWGEPHGFFTRSLEKIGEESFGIYLIHLFFLAVFGGVLLPRAGLDYNNLLFYPTLVLLTLISSYWSVRGLYRLPFSAIVIGKPRKKEEGKPPQAAQIRSAQ